MKPTSLVFENLTFQTDRKKRVILNDCTGCVLPGELLAVLGPSGSGKTTLLDFLADRKKSGISLTKGRVLFNGKEVGKDERRSLISFVGQEDCLFSSFTVRETLNTVAKFRFGLSISKEEMTAKVDACLRDMGLLSVADVRVGEAVIGRKGLSGGQRRRLSIALELISSAPIILLDEITSGLDFASAYGVMKRVKRLTRLRHSIIVIIHNPSSQIFDLFDRLLLLANGKTMYMGESGRSVEYFKGRGFTCPPHFNHAEFLLTLVSTDFAAALAQSDVYIDAGMVKDLATAFETSTEKQLEIERVSTALKSSQSTLALEDDPALAHQKARGASLREQLMILLARDVTNTLRNPNLFVNRLLLLSVVSIVLGLIFYQVGSQTDDAGVSATVAGFFANSMFCTFLTIMILPTMINDRAVINRERATGLYRTLPFAISIFVNGLIVTLAIGALVSVITFYLMAFQMSLDRYFLMVWTNFLFVEMTVVLISLIVRSHVIGIIVVIGYVACGVMVEGYFMTFDRISWVVRWIGFVTPQRFIWRGLVLNEYQGDRNFSDALLYPNGQAVLDFYFDANDGLQSYWTMLGIAWTFNIVITLVLIVVLTR